MKLTYAGIGARATPRAVLERMTVMAAWLARHGWHLHSGGAAGADSAFANGTPDDRRTLFLPWSGYRGHAGDDCIAPTRERAAACLAIAAPLHPAWHRCSAAVHVLHVRNAAILLGLNADTPVDAAVCWTRDGAVTGGTGMAIRIAHAHRIPVLNLGALSPRTVCERLRDIALAKS